MSETTTPAGARRADARFQATPAFMPGELAVQQRAGRGGGGPPVPMLEPAKLGGGIGAFLADRTFAVITARDAAGRLWTSPLSGPPGFLRPPTPATLAIRCRFADGDPLHGLPAGQQAGLVVVEFAARRRVRINGTLAQRATTASHRGRAGLRQLPAVHPPAPPRPGRTTPAAGGPGRRPARRGLSPAGRRADPRGGHVLPRHREPGPRLRRLAPGRPAGIRPRGRRPGSGGPTTRATTCSTPSATSPSTPRPRCCSPTSAPATRCTCPAPPRSTGTRPASPGTTGEPAGGPSSRCSGSSRAACYRRDRSGARSLPAHPADHRLKGPAAMTESRPAVPAVRPRQRAQEGPGRRGRLEHPRPAEGLPRLYGRLGLAQPRQHIAGRAQIVEFLTRKWERELDYALRKSLWGFGENRIAVRFQYESHDAEGQWWRSYGNELWEFDENGLMRRREASINDRRSPRTSAATSAPAPSQSTASTSPSGDRAGAAGGT